MRYNNIMKKKKIFIGFAILVVVGILVFLISYFSLGNTTPDVPGTVTLSQGTQTRFGDISIGLSNIESNSALLSIHSETLDTTTQKQTKSGDVVEAYGYTININAIKGVFNLSFLPGASQGYVKFVINKK
jgi:uncharacterized membrane-anchored protein YitT (DUF2179 family)